MKLLPPLWTCALLLCAPGCLTEVSHSPAETQIEAPAISRATRAWEVVERGKVAGVVVEFSEQEGDRLFFSVRNVEQQELGMVDAYGRAWRFRPYERESDWLGTGTVLVGVRGILGLEGAAELYEIPIELLIDEAAHPATAGE